MRRAPNGRQRRARSASHRPLCALNARSPSLLLVWACVCRLQNSAAISKNESAAAAHSFCKVALPWPDRGCLHDWPLAFSRSLLVQLLSLQTLALPSPPCTLQPFVFLLNGRLTAGNLRNGACCPRPASPACCPALLTVLLPRNPHRVACLGSVVPAKSASHQFVYPATTSASVLPRR